MKLALFDSDAERELFQYVDWYESRKKGLGLEFENVVMKISEKLAENPMFPSSYSIGKNFRRIILNRFPFSIIFRIQSYGILIIAIVHHKRRPGYWKQRN
jgi:toxin ParE1/3/4